MEQELKFMGVYLSVLFGDDGEALILHEDECIDNLLTNGLKVAIIAMARELL